MDGCGNSGAPEEEQRQSSNIYTHWVYFSNLTTAASTIVNKLALLQQKDNTDKLCNHLQLVCKNHARILKGFTDIVRLHSMKG